VAGIILVVNDHRTHRLVLQGSLRQESYRVASAAGAI